MTFDVRNSSSELYCRDNLYIFNLRFVFGFSFLTCRNIGVAVSLEFYRDATPGNFAAVTCTVIYLSDLHLVIEAHRDYVVTRSLQALDLVNICCLL